MDDEKESAFCNECAEQLLQKCEIMSYELSKSNNLKLEEPFEKSKAPLVTKKTSVV